MYCLFVRFLQAIAIAGCFLDEGSILVVCPAVLRFSWAEELERWLPFCLPADIHLGNILCCLVYGAVFCVCPLTSILSALHHARSQLVMYINEN